MTTIRYDYDVVYGTHNLGQFIYNAKNIRYTDFNKAFHHACRLATYGFDVTISIHQKVNSARSIYYDVNSKYIKFTPCAKKNYTMKLYKI